MPMHLRLSTVTCWCASRVRDNGEGANMMSRQQPGDHIDVRIRGDVSGQVAAGKHIRQYKNVGKESSQVSTDDLAALRSVLDQLRAQVESAAPPEKKVAALERADELSEAVTAEHPDVSTMEYVRGWFGKNVPSLAGAMASVLSHPLVVKVMQAAGNDVLTEFERRLGQG